MGYKYRNGETPDHVDSSNSDSTTTTEMAGTISDSDSDGPKTKKKLNMDQMSDSLRHDEQRLIKTPNDQKIKDRYTKNTSDYMIQMAQDDSADAAKKPQQTRDALAKAKANANKTGQPGYFGDGLAVYPKKKSQ